MHRKEIGIELKSHVGIYDLRFYSFLKSFQIEFSSQRYFSNLDVECMGYFSF